MAEAVKRGKAGPPGGRTVLGVGAEAVVAGAAAYGVADGVGLAPDKAAIVGATAAAVSGASDVAESIRRRVRAAPSKQEIRVRTAVHDYLGAIQEQLSKLDISKLSIYIGQLEKYQLR